MLKSTIQLYQNAYSGLSREVWILSIISLVNRAGTMVFPFMTIYITESLGFTLKEAGFIMGFFGLGSILGSYCGGWLSDRIGCYKVQIGSLLLTSFTLLFILKVQTFWEISMMAFILSTVADAFRPANKVAVSNYSKPENLTRSFALLRLAVNLGFAIGPAMGGILAAWKGYDWLFYADSITCFVAAILFKLSLKDDFKERKEQTNLKQKENKIPATSSPYNDGYFIFFLFIIAIMAFSFLQFFYTMPVFFKQDLGLDEGQIGLFMGLNGLIIVILEMPLVYLAEKQFSKFTVMTAGALLIGIGYLFFILPTSWLGAAAMGIFIMAIGEIYYMPFSSAFVATRSSESNRGQYMALYTIAWATASVAAPTAGFQIVEHFGFDGLWFGMFIISAIGSIGFWFLGQSLKKI